MKTSIHHTFLAATALGLLAFLAACGTSTGATSLAVAQPSTPVPTARDQPSCPTQLAKWSPANQKAWKLIVSFLVGSRQGQQETSYMTFSPDGKLTATFPSATPGAPDALPPAIDGKWCATGATMFAYEFRDPIMAGGHMVAYVQTALSATMTSATTYRADGVGVAYSTKTAMPLPGQYNVPRTVAVAIQDT